MNSKNIDKDSVLERLVNETAQELGISSDMVWKVFVHCYTSVYTFLTEDNLQYLTKEAKTKRARNVVIPGLGRINNIFGKTYKTKGAKENQFIKPNKYEQANKGKSDSELS